MADDHDEDNPTGGESRTDFLLALMRRLSAVRDPMELIATFAEGLRRAYGPNASIYLDTKGLPPGHYRLLRFQSADGKDLVPPALPGADPAGVPVRRGGLLGEITAAGRPFVGDPALAPDDTDLGPTLARFRSLIATPVATASWWIDWVLLLDAGPAALTRDDLDDLILQANLVGSVIQNMRVARELADANRRIEHELEEVARLQRALLPAATPDLPGLDVAASYETAVQAGGDLYDFIPLPDGRWAIVVADASGHGPAAAVMAAMVSTLLRAGPVPLDGPAWLLRHANAHLCDRGVEASFVTAFVAFYEPASRRLVYARAGHNPPLLSGAAGPNGPAQGPRELGDAPGLPLGVLPTAAYDERTITLRPGQVLLLYTDGVTEAGPSPADFWGAEGLTRAFADAGGSAADVVRRVLEGLREVENGAPRRDDQTLIAIRVKPDDAAGV